MNVLLWWSRQKKPSPSSLGRAGVTGYKYTGVYSIAVFSSLSPPRRTSRATWGWMAARGTVSKPLGEVCTSLHAQVLPCCNCKKMHGVISYLVLGIAQSPGPLFLPPPCSCNCSLNGLASSATKTLFKPKTKMIRQA